MKLRYKKSGLKQLYSMTQSALKIWACDELEQMGYDAVDYDDGYLYAPGITPVLVCAHLDIVAKTPPASVKDYHGIITGYNANGKRAILGGDDRNGVFAALNIAYDTGAHILLLEDEECGGIGADKFVASGIAPDCGFIIELDRRGINDAVFYDCDNAKFERFVLSYGFDKALGSFSDISTIAPALGIAAVNLSAGFFGEHTTGEYTEFRALERNIYRAACMARSGRVFDYIPAPKHNYWRNDYKYSYGGYWDDWGDVTYSVTKDKSARADNVTYLPAPKDAPSDNDVYDPDNDPWEIYDEYAETEERIAVLKKNIADAEQYELDYPDSEMYNDYLEDWRYELEDLELELEYLQWEIYDSESTIEGSYKS